MSLFSFYKLDISVGFCLNNQYSFHRLFSLTLVVNSIGSVKKVKLKFICFSFLFFFCECVIQTKGVSLKTVNLAGMGSKLYVVLSFHKHNVFHTHFAREDSARAERNAKNEGAEGMTGEFYEDGGSVRGLSAPKCD